MNERMADDAGLAVIREVYGVPVRLGARVLHRSRLGTVIGAMAHFLLVALDDEPTVTLFLHPAFDVRYLPGTSC